MLHKPTKKESAKKKEGKTDASIYTSGTPHTTTQKEQPVKKTFLVINALSGIYALLKWVFYLFKNGDVVSHGFNIVRGISARYNQFHLGWLTLYEFYHFIFAHQPKRHCHIEFISNDNIIESRTQLEFKKSKCHLCSFFVSHIRVFGIHKVISAKTNLRNSSNL